MPIGFGLCEAQFRIPHGRASFFVIFMIKYYKCKLKEGRLLIVFNLFSREKVADP